MLCTNMVKNCPVVVDYIIVPDKIFGLKLHSPKGEKLIRRPDCVPSDQILDSEAPSKMHHGLRISIYRISMNKVPF